MPREHTYGEAFLLMRYRDEVTGKVEVIWNSRDGVTPFVVPSRDGNRAPHVEWHLDEYAPRHVPAVGDRIFVDMTEERARELATRNVKRWWKGTKRLPPMRDDGRWATPEEAIEQFAKEYVGNGDQPDLVVVDDEMRRRFEEAANAS